MDSTRALQQLFSQIAGSNGDDDAVLDASLKVSRHLFEIVEKDGLSREDYFRHKLSQDQVGKSFLARFTDQAFRSRSSRRTVDQMVYLIGQFGVPKFVSILQKCQLIGLFALGRLAPGLFSRLATQSLKAQMKNLVTLRDGSKLSAPHKKSKTGQFSQNVNVLGEVVLGEKAAKDQLDHYIELVKTLKADAISIKLSSLYSQMDVLEFDRSVAVLVERVSCLLSVVQQDGWDRDGLRYPMINLDMESYGELELSVAVFKSLIATPEFLSVQLGIALQAYLPDSFAIQKTITQLARERVSAGGVPVKIRIVKGANLSTEKIESDLRGWRSPVYGQKREVDANFKRMVDYGLQPDHIQYARIGVATHNMFELGFCLALQTIHQVQESVDIEMLQGMAPPVAKVIDRLGFRLLIYCPIVSGAVFHTAVAYLVRRLDENTQDGNFLKDYYTLFKDSEVYKHHQLAFTDAFRLKNEVSTAPIRTQNRQTEQLSFSRNRFRNVADTDFTLPHNREWLIQVLSDWKARQIESIPLVVGGHHQHSPGTVRVGYSPSKPDVPIYDYSLADGHLLSDALDIATLGVQRWAETSLQDRLTVFEAVAAKLAQSRGNLLGVLVKDVGKPVRQADSEISEAIDFVNYYSLSLQQWESERGVELGPKGVCLITSPWNFPVAISVGMIMGALAGGNSVMFKPAPEAVLVGWELVQVLWAAGVPVDMLQFINFDEKKWGRKLIGDPRINCLALTGATDTARMFRQTRPQLELVAETGGKNAIIVTQMADKDMAISDIVQSAFLFSGQKCSAASLLILEAPLYNDSDFLDQLRDAAASLPVGSSWEPGTQVCPMIRPPESKLKRGLTKLSDGEAWLLKPKQHPENPLLWSPGIKLGVQPGSFFHKTELFGPVLGVMCAQDLDDAIRIANDTPYGLTGGLQSLDGREQRKWLAEIEVGNRYINRPTTGAIVGRQPFGGWKNSSFGWGFKAGGPNYLLQFMSARQTGVPTESLAIKPDLMHIDRGYRILDPSVPELSAWTSSLENYCYWTEHYSRAHLVSGLIGEENYLAYAPVRRVLIRVDSEALPLDILRVIAACFLSKSPLDISVAPDVPYQTILQEIGRKLKVPVFVEDDEGVIDQLMTGRYDRLRGLVCPSEPVLNACVFRKVHCDLSNVLMTGKIELLKYLREFTVTRKTHRYGWVSSVPDDPLFRSQ